jgi:tetratricopeptide (TPR) repeat protein
MYQSFTHLIPAKRMLNFFVLLIVAVFAQPVLCDAATVDKSTLNASIDELDNLLDNREKYLEKRNNAIAALKRQAAEKPSATTLSNVAKAYIEVDNDSAVRYFRRAIAFAPEGSEQHCLLQAQLAARMPVSGGTQEAIELYEGIDSTIFSQDNLVEYYDAGCRMYVALTSVFSNNIDVAKQYSAKVLAYKKSLLSAMSAHKDTPRYRMEHGEYLLRLGKWDAAEALVRDVFDTQAVGTDLHTRAAHILSHIEARHGDDESCVNYLVNAVISDVQAGSVELPSLQDLGRAMYDRGDDDHALIYLNMAMSNAVNSHAWTRMIQLADAIPMVQEVQQQNAIDARNRLILTVVALLILLVLFGMSTFYLRKTLRKQTETREKLRESNQLKEQYISHFLTLCAVYMDRLTQFSKMVKRKLTAGKVDDVTRMLKSGKYIEEQSEEFFAVFDDAFLHIYPTFVADVNKLCRDDAQIELKEGEVMNADLRLLAFMRLGIEDSSCIAQILNFSVNTVYAYRNKIKQRAINRATFEHDIMQIGAA